MLLIGQVKNDVITKIQEYSNLNFIIQPFRPEISRGEISIIILHGISMYGFRRFPGVLGQKLDPEYVPITDISHLIKKELDLLHAFLRNEAVFRTIYLLKKTYV